MHEIFLKSTLMQLFKYETLTLSQQQHPVDVLLPPRGKQSHLSKGHIEKLERVSKAYEFNTKLLHGKALVCDRESRHV